MAELKINVNKKNSTPSDDTIDLRGQEAPNHPASNAALPQKPKIAKDEAASFSSHNLASEAKIKEMERNMEEEVKSEEIDESLSEIYQDDNGKMVDVKKLEIKKKHGFLFWLFMFVIFIALAGGAGYAAYFLYTQKGTETAMVEFSIDGKSDAMAGEEVEYNLNYKNISNVDIKNVGIELAIPENMKVISSDPSPTSNKNIWDFPVLNAHRSGILKIKAALIGPVDVANTLNAKMTYTPTNFSSQFTKDASIITTVKDIGIDFNFDYVSNALVGENNEAVIRFIGKPNNTMKNFTLFIDPQENVKFITPNASSTKGKEKTATSSTITMVNPFTWQVGDVTDIEQEIKLQFIIKDKTGDSEKIKLKFGQPDAENKFVFLEKTLEFQIVKNNLNLTMIMNGARDAAGIDFGQTLNYSIVYANKGDADMKDVMIMAVINGDFLDWGSLKDANKGVAQSNTITWSKEEIPGLASVGLGKEGTIDFSINVASTTEIDITKNYEIKSYAQFVIGTDTSKPVGDDMKSNSITAKINSDVKFKEAVRYFDDDNIAVGSGPLPPKVGQTTSFKVYWSIANNLHELGGMKVETTLPANVKWEDKNRMTVGTVQFDQKTNKITWNIGRLPISVPTADGEFVVSITPTADDADKIIVLTSGSALTGTDNVTKGAITKSTKPKTTRLEDDTIANSDGRVVE
jgi:uncharacterized repeat protein (TIGR01451 family)